MSKKEVIAVITQVDGIIDEMFVFTDNNTAEKHFADTITNYANETEIEIAIEDGYWQKGDTMFSIVHSTNQINVCACATK